MGSRLEAGSDAVRKRIQGHTFDDEGGDEYEASAFGGFGDYFRRKKIKLQNLDAERRRHNADKPQIFRGIVAHINGYTQPSLNDLHAMIVDHGGGFIQYLDGKTMVTHIIASNLTPKKKIEFRRYRIVKPAWIVDSIKAGKTLPWENYRVVDEGVKQNLIGFKNGSLTSQASTQQKGYREQTDTSWYTEQVQGAAEKIDKKPLPIDDDQAILDTYDHEFSHDADFDDTAPAVDLDPPLETIDDDDLEIAANMSSYQQDEEDADLDDSESLHEKSGAERVQGVDNPKLEEPPKDPGESQIQQPSPTKGLTAEEHNAELLKDPKVWKSTVVNPGFLKQYYEESRLHHLSTWKAELKSKLQALAQEQTSSRKARLKRPPGARRYIFHVDFDSFFAAVSLLKNPEWIELPACVAHGGGSGSEIASCNYPARKYGVKNGMWMKKAQELCPDIKVLPYDFKAYEDASRHFYSAIMESGGIVQSVSIDEALIDLSVVCNQAGGHDGRGVNEGSIWREQSKADEVAQKLRATIKEKTGCAVSVGIGGNVLLAKLALRKAKPAGQHQIKPEDILDFIGELLVQDLPGVAYSIGGKLEEMGIKYIKDLRGITKERLVTTLGPKTGEKIWDYSRGIDKTEVGEQVVRKSVSAEVNWGIRFATQQQADDFIRTMCEELQRRLLNEQVKGKQFTMKIMRRAADAPLDPPKHLGHGKCDVFNKSSVLGVATNDKSILTREALSILKGYGFSPGELRGIGVQMTKLEPMKAAHELDSSQRRLQFKKPDPKPPLAHAPIIDGEDNVDSPRKAVKFVKHPAAALSGQIMEETKPLNIMGTQFMLPTQVDPAVLAELPADIRSKLGSRPKSSHRDFKQPGLTFKPKPLPEPYGDLHQPPQAEQVLNLPTQSQLDPETLAALPEDIRAEVLASYARPPPQVTPRFPSSPSKPKPTKPLKNPATPTKKRTLLSRTRGPKDTSTLTQSNFISRPQSAGPLGLDPTADIDSDFLAALPADIRAEVLEQQKQSRLQQRSGLAMTARKLRQAPSGLVPQRQLRLPPKPAKPTFTSKKLTAAPDLREAVSQWVDAMDGDEPDEEDVTALKGYLVRVVETERDMGKAVGVVKWLAWLVSEMSAEQAMLWENALDALKEGVQGAVRARGLGGVDF